MFTPGELDPTITGWLARVETDTTERYVLFRRGSLSADGFTDGLPEGAFYAASVAERGVTNDFARVFRVTLWLRLQMPLSPQAAVATGDLNVYSIRGADVEIGFRVVWSLVDQLEVRHSPDRGINWQTYVNHDWSALITARDAITFKGAPYMGSGAFQRMGRC